MVNVPASYVPLLQQMAAATGIPYSVEAAQANAESGFNATAVSSAGAEGWLQFLPSTYNTYASQAGVAEGTEFNPADESKVYDVFMSELLKEEGGNLRDALAAYNAGPGNVAAGYSYADSILSAAGQSNIKVTSSTTPASTTGISIPGIGGLSVSGVVKDAIQAFLDAFGIKTDLKDMFERFGLIILGFALVILGIHILSSGSGGGQPINIETSTTEGEEGTTSTRKVKTPVSKHTKTTVTKAAGTEAAEEAGVVAAA